MKKVLGISCYYHDSAACIVVGGKIVAATQEERFTRDKHTADFPVESIKYCLEESGLSIDELDAIVFYDKPLLKFERLLETYYAFAPKGLISFLKAIPVWLKEKMFLKKQLLDGLKKVAEYDKRKIKFLFTEHHLSHAASTFFTSPYSDSAILTIDGVGEWCTASIAYGKNNQIIFEKELNFPHSVGLLYSAFTYYLGFTVNSGEYKLMGLAPYGDPTANQTIEYIQKIKEKLVNIKDDGSIWLDQEYYNYATGLRMVNDAKWEKLFGFSRREDENDLQQHHCNLALAIQIVTEEIVIKMAREAKKITNAKNICLAGGVALNCVANGKLIKENIFENVYVTPASGDAGGALGAALVGYYMYFNQDRICNEQTDTIEGSYLGPSYSDKEIESMIRKTKANFVKPIEFSTVAEFTAQKIAEGKVIGWFQGRMEFGPRALGNRSILGDARNPEMQKKLNLKIKYREGFRPFAPSVLAEDANAFFDLEIDSPYMLFVSPVKESRRKTIPENYFKLPLWDRLYIERSDIQSVTHLDFSARIQCVHKETNLRYHQLITEFKKLTDYGLVVNTSFNVRGEPIVCTPYDAYRCFMSTDMDFLVIENYIFEKENQNDWQNKEKWLVEFKLD
jgi:carbamoyltransferase